MINYFYVIQFTKLIKFVKTELLQANSRALILAKTKKGCPVGTAFILNDSLINPDRLKNVRPRVLPYNLMQQQ